MFAYVRSRLGLLGVVCLFGVCSDRASAGLMIGGDGPLGSVSGEFTYSPVNANAATITVELTNTSPPANGGFMTAFAFNNPSNSITGVSFMQSGPVSLNLFGGPNYQNTIPAAPFGNFDIGAGTGSPNNFNGGGMPSQGLGVGDTGIFTFDVVGTGLDLLTEEAFFSMFSEGPGQGNQRAVFLTRFRGFEDGGSDKVPVGPMGNDNDDDFPPPVQTVPEPGTLTILGIMGLGGAFVAARRRKRKESL